MSYYEGLPIYKSAMDTVVVVERVTPRFAKRHKYTLGALQHRELRYLLDSLRRTRSALSNPGDPA